MSSFVPPARPSGIRLRSAVLLVVGVDDDVAWTCRVAAAEADIGFTRASQGIAACRTIEETRPAIVALGPAIWSDERRAITFVARQLGARVIDLPASASKALIKDALDRFVSGGAKSAAG